MEYRDANELKVRTQSYHHGGRWRKTLKGEKAGRMMWMRKSFKHKRTWAYNPETLTGLELKVDRALHPEAYRDEGFSVEPAYNDLEPTVSHFTLTEDAYKLYGVHPDTYTHLPYDTTVGLEKSSKEDY